MEEEMKKVKEDRESCSKWKGGLTKIATGHKYIWPPTAKGLYSRPCSKQNEGAL